MCARARLFQAWTAFKQTGIDLFHSSFFLTACDYDVKPGWFDLAQSDFRSLTRLSLNPIKRKLLCTYTLDVTSDKQRPRYHAINRTLGCKIEDAKWASKVTLWWDTWFYQSSLTAILLPCTGSGALPWGDLHRNMGVHITSLIAKKMWLNLAKFHYKLLGEPFKLPTELEVTKVWCN